MRHGAAIQIQQIFRIWKLTVLINVIRIQQGYRRYCTRKKIRYFVNVVRGSLRVARWLYYRRIRKRQIVGKKRIYRVVLQGMIESIGFRIREVKYKKELQKVPMQLLRQATKRGDSLPLSLSLSLSLSISLSHSLCLSLCLCLSVTHTHTHTQVL
jgi:hypothetical protein